MQMLMYTVTAIVLYVFSDWLLLRLEKWRGKPFARRQIVFFMIILILSVGAFELIQQFAGTMIEGGIAAPVEETVEKQEPELIPSPALNRGE